MLHPDTELKFIRNELGYGIVATKFIPKGTITWVGDELDREFTPLQIKKMDPIYKDLLSTYTYRNNKGNYVLCWDISRFINHSFKSNCLTTAYEFEIAVRDIHHGEELTSDYGYLNIDKPFKPANEGTRRKIVYPDDLLKYYKTWDKKLIKAIKYTPKVIQPLRPLISEKLWKKVQRIAEEKETMDSILNCYFTKNFIGLAT